MTTCKEISKYLNEELRINDIEDHCCNGLQLENEKTIAKIGFAVDACKETFQKTSEKKCQMLIVHHGLIWNELKHIKGNTYQNIKYLINNNLALYAAHLPLDMHNKYGNNIQLAKILRLNEIRAFGYHHGKAIGVIGNVNTNLDKIKQILTTNKMQTLTLNFGPEKIKKIAIVSGGASEDIYQAIAAGADLFLTGEPMHHLHHVAKENKINVIFAGHYETEVWGVKALMPLLKEKFKVEVEFLDVPTLI